MRRFWKRKKKKAPEKWAEKLETQATAAPGGSELKEKVWDSKPPDPGDRKKYRLPGFRLAKRVAACLLMVFHFFVGQMALTGAQGNVGLAFVFVLTAFLLADYLYKTRKKGS